MARSTKKLEVVRAPFALDALDGIWRWNAEKFGIDHADQYLNFLDREFESLETTYNNGTKIDDRPVLRWKLLQRRPHPHGHIVVYRIQETAVQVLRIYHTAEDWQQKITELE